VTPNVIQYKDSQDFIKENNLVVKSMGCHVQCILNFEDNEEADGGTILVPKFHKHIEQWCKDDNRKVQRNAHLHNENIKKEKKQKNLLKKQQKEQRQRQKEKEKEKEIDSSSSSSAAAAAAAAAAAGMGKDVVVTVGHKKAVTSDETQTLCTSSTATIAAAATNSCDSMPRPPPCSDLIHPPSLTCVSVQTEVSSVGATDEHTSYKQSNSEPSSHLMSQERPLKMNPVKDQKQKQKQKQQKPQQPAPVLSDSSKWGSEVRLRQPLPWVIMSDDSELLSLAQRVSCCSQKQHKTSHHSTSPQQ
jgi:hypothetical protein